MTWCPTSFPRPPGLGPEHVTLGSCPYQEVGGTEHWEAPLSRGGLLCSWGSCGHLSWASHSEVTQEAPLIPHFGLTCHPLRSLFLPLATLLVSMENVFTSSVLFPVSVFIKCFNFSENFDIHSQYFSN